ncbi:MAG: MMPL family transporter [Verrucomicrobia bacterium]|nr:MMPL family transporter [Verrucomicrobiota bacterium]
MVAVVLCLPFFLRLPQFKLSSEASTLLEGDQRNLASYEKVRQILAEVEVLVISLECADVFSLQGIDSVRRVSDAFQKLPGVEDVKSLTHSVKPVRRGLGFEMVPLVPSGLSAEHELEQFKKFCLEHPLIRDVMVSADGRHTLITVTCRRPLDTPEAQRQLRAEVDETLAPFQREGLRFQLLTVPLIEHEIRSALWQDVQRFLPASAILLALILWWTFRSWRILLLVAASQLFVLFALPGAMQMTGFSLSVFTVMLFPLLSGIHLAQLAHVYSAFQVAQLSGQTTEEALRTMLATVFKSCLFSLVTTAVGLLSLATSEVRQIREFGFLGTFGVCLIFFFTFGPGLALMKWAFERRPLRAQSGGIPGLPAAQPSQATQNLLENLSSGGSRGNQAHFQKSEIRNQKSEIGQRLLTPAATILQTGSPNLPNRGWTDWIARFVERHGKATIIAVAATILVTCWGISKVRTDIRAVEFLNRQSQTRQAVEELDRIYGGINVVQIEIDSGSENGINQLDFLRYVEQLQRYAETYPGVSAAYSYAQLLSMINQIWEEGRADALKLPQNPLLINLFVLALKSQNYPFLTALCDKTYRTAYLVVRTRDMPSDRYLSIVHAIERHAEATKPAGISISAAAGIHSILEADRRILRSQMNSAGSSSAVIGVVLSLLWRSPVLASLSLITNAIPVAFVLAIAGFTGVPLNCITIMVAAICLGIAVDDSIHFITHWRDARRSGLSPVEAVASAFWVKGRPIIFTSWILIAVFSIFWFSSFPPVVEFGLLSAVAFAGALATVLFFLPAVLCVFPRKSEAK